MPAKSVLMMLAIFMALVFLANGEEEVRVNVRAIRCNCIGKDQGPYGDWWFWRGSCPDGYGYKTSCMLGIDICCFPRA